MDLFADMIPQETTDWYQQELKKYVRNIGILGLYVNVEGIDWL